MIQGGDVVAAFVIFSFALRQVTNKNSTGPIFLDIIVQVIGSCLELMAFFNQQILLDRELGSK